MLATLLRILRQPLVAGGTIQGELLFTVNFAIRGGHSPTRFPPRRVHQENELVLHGLVQLPCDDPKRLAFVTPEGLEFRTYRSEWIVEHLGTAETLTFVGHFVLNPVFEERRTEYRVNRIFELQSRLERLEHVYNEVSELRNWKDDDAESIFPTVIIDIEKVDR
jgi:hypothetical protein